MEKVGFSAEQGKANARIKLMVDVLEAESESFLRLMRKLKEGIECQWNCR